MIPKEHIGRANGLVQLSDSIASLSALPLGLLITVPLAQYVFEPFLSVDGVWADSLGRWIGVGPGRGIALVFILTGLFNMLVLGLGFLHPRVRFVEDEIPDAIKT